MTGTNRHVQETPSGFYRDLNLFSSRCKVSGPKPKPISHLPTLSPCQHSFSTRTPSPLHSTQFPPHHPTTLSQFLTTPIFSKLTVKCLPKDAGSSNVMIYCLSPWKAQASNAFPPTITPSPLTLLAHPTFRFCEVCWDRCRRQAGTVMLAFPETGKRFSPLSGPHTNPPFLV